jgi:LmbE family N-acetylglucosaminyl deacetylase
MKKISIIGIFSIVAVAAIGIYFLNREGKRSENERDDTSSMTDRVTSQGGISLTDGQMNIAADGSDRPTVDMHQQLLEDKLKSLNMSPSIRYLLGLSGDKNDRDARRDALKTLTRTLKPDDVDALSVFLDFRHSDHPELSSASFEALKNDALVVLLNQKELPEGLGDQLVKMFKDEKHSKRWRDYSLQYFSAYYDAIRTTESSEAATITNAYAVALDSRTEKFSGTALMALERLSREHEEFNRVEVGDKAVKIVLASDTCNDSRITALRVCAMMNREEILPQARILAQTGETMPVRLAAIATVGDLGDESDLEYLQSLAASDDKRLQRISQTASKSLRERINDAAAPMKDAEWDS